jgi:hypothetical protein
MILLYYASQHHWDDSCAPPHPVFFDAIEMGSHKLFVRGYPQATILSIPASKVARITDVSHQCPVTVIFKIR